jgi:predicted SnoaL-like aldol condensation-catalyzing enzyme
MATLALMLASGAAAREPAPKDVNAVNRALVTRFYDLFYRQKKVREAFTTYVAPTLIEHDPLIPDGRDAAIAQLEPYFAKMDGLSYEVQRVIVDGNMAAVHSRMHLTTGDRGVAVVDLVRIDQGKIAERWVVTQAVPEKGASGHPMF